MDALPWVPINPLSQGQFFYVDRLPELEADQLENKFLLEGPAGFRMLFDTENGAIWSTNCPWCKPPIASQRFSIPDKVKQLFEGLDGVTLEEMSHNGRLEQIRAFIHEHSSEMRQPMPGFGSSNSRVIGSLVPTFNRFSFPQNRAGLAQLNTDVSVIVTLPDKTIKARIVEVIPGEVTLYKLNLKIRESWTKYIIRNVSFGYLAPGANVVVSEEDLLPSSEYNVVQVKYTDTSWWKAGELVKLEINR